MQNHPELEKQKAVTAAEGPTDLLKKLKKIQPSITATEADNKTQMTNQHSRLKTQKGQRKRV